MSSPTVTQWELTVIEPRIFEANQAITPGQFITFNVQNALQKCRLLRSPVLRVAVLDSPIANGNDESPLIAAMIVPKNRETDWIFCTESGHLQLIFNFPGVFRLILISNMPPHEGPSIYKPGRATNPVDLKRLENELKPLLKPLHPKVSSNSETLFVKYDQDDVVYHVTVAKFVGGNVGKILVEDVDVVGSDRNKNLRRRLRFKRMPNLIQSKALLVPIIGDDEATTQPTDLESLRRIEGVKFKADTFSLVHQYLNPMVAGLSLIASYLNEHIQQGFTPKALCLGIGGGVLLSFLDKEMKFEITGVDADDDAVLDAAKEYFRFREEGYSIKVIRGDAIDMLKNLPLPKSNTDDSGGEEDVHVPDAKFDAIFVDLDSGDAKNRFTAPPPEFVDKYVLAGLRSLFDKYGVLIINVVPLNNFLFLTLVEELEKLFHKIYKINVGNQNNCVVMATVSPASYNDNDDDNEFLEKLKSLIPGTYINSIVEF